MKTTTEPNPTEALGTIKLGIETTSVLQEIPAINPGGIKGLALRVALGGIAEDQ